MNLEEIKSEFDGFPESHELSSSKSIISYSLGGVKVDVVNYRYPPLFPYITENDIILYSLEDIAAMKLEAIKGWGKRRDFYDLYFLLQKFPLQSMFEFNLRKFKERNPFMILKSLSYFDDADNDPEIQVPQGVHKVEWDLVKKSIVDALKEYLT